MNLIFYHKKKDGTEVPFFKTPLSPRFQSFVEGAIYLYRDKEDGAKSLAAGTSAGLSVLCALELSGRIPYECEEYDIEEEYLHEVLKIGSDVNILDYSFSDEFNAKEIELSIRQAIARSFESLLNWVMTAIEPIYNDDSSYIKYVDLVENMIWCRKATFDGTPGIIIKWPCNIDIGDESFTESEFYYKFSGESWIYSLDDKVVFIKLGED